MLSQRYVSPELTHFVGQGLSEEEQYSALVHGILKTGWLKHDPQVSAPAEVLKLGAILYGSQPEVETDAAYAQCVCFCDIPVTDLEIHMSKYSRFGLSFLKPFLISKGANPVLYVANDSPALTFGLLEPYVEDEVSPRATVFKAGIQLYHELMWELTGHRSPLDESQLGQSTDAKRLLYKVGFFIDNYILSFIKYFDSSSADEDEANVYMEREWRVLGDITFALSDVHRVFMPERYAKRFREDLPDYVGQLTFSDNI